MAEQDNDWPAGLTLPQCNCHMLDSGILSDVTFKVGFPEGEKKTMAAHKFALVSRSPVWKAMFCGDLAANNEDPIPIEDIEPDIFRDLLVFLYTDDVQLNKDNALHLQYAAKKYFVPTLELKCIQFLKDHITAGTVCTILSHAINFQDKELEDLCMRYVVKNTKAVLEGEDFLNLSHNALCLLLEQDKLDIKDEIELFKSCSYWAKESLKKQGVTTNESLIRETLDRALFLIRLPTADLKTFAVELGSSKVLTAEEKNDIYCYLVLAESALGGRVAGFSTISRDSRLTTHCCNRFQSVGTDTSIWACTGTVDSIFATVDAPIMLFGVGLYGTRSSKPIKTLQVEIFDNQATSLISQNWKGIVCTGTDTPIPIQLSKAIHLEVGVKYEICVSLKCDITYSGVQGLDSICTHGCTFKISKGGRCQNGTSESIGQLPQLLFRKK